MFTVIVGGTQLGYQLTRVLLTTGQEVVVIDKSSRRCQFFSDDLGSSTLHGDGAEEETLRRAGVGRADLFIAATNRDEVNLVACQLAKHIFQVPRIMTLIQDPKNENVFDALNIGVVINATDLAVTRFEEEIPGKPIQHLKTLRVPETELVSVSIPPDASVVGKTLAEIELPPNSSISLIIKKNRVAMPSGEVALDEDDEVIAVTVEDEEQTLYDILTGVE